MMIKRDEGSVLVVESAMIMQLVMLMIMLFVMSAILILQKNQLYYNVNHALQIYVKTIDKPQVFSVYTNQNHWGNSVSVEQYLQLYKNPRPYRHLFYKTDNSVAFPKLVHTAIKTYDIGKSLNEQMNVTISTRHLIQKIANVEIRYAFDIWNVIHEDVLLGKISLRAPILAINDFIRQVDFANELVNGHFVPLQQSKQLSVMFRQVNEGLRRFGGK